MEPGISAGGAACRPSGQHTDRILTIASSGAAHVSPVSVLRPLPVDGADRRRLQSNPFENVKVNLDPSCLNATSTNKPKENQKERIR